MGYRDIIDGSFVGADPIYSCCLHDLWNKNKKNKNLQFKKNIRYTKKKKKKKKKNNKMKKKMIYLIMIMTRMDMTKMPVIHVPEQKKNKLPSKKNTINV